MVTEQDWQAEAIRLKAEGKESAEIAEIVGKHAATVRKVIARAREEAGSDSASSNEAGESEVSNGNGHRSAYIPDVVENSRTGERFAVTTDPYAAGGVRYEPLPGQTGIEDFIEEAGEAVGDMPPREMDGGVEVDTRLKGTRQLAIDFGPESDIPLGGTLVIKSDKLASGFYGLGDVITGTFTARVVDVGGKERLQRASEEFRAQPQSHVALITELSIGGAP
jgi:hypothetical protein